MDIRRASFADDSRVLRRDVADVRREPIVREQRVHPPHRAIPHDLRHDGCGGDRSAALVPVDDGQVLRRRRPEPEAVDEASLGRRRQCAQAGSHRLQVRPVETRSVDLRGRDDPHRERRRAAHYPAENLLPLARRQLLGVVEPRKRANAMIPKALVVEEHSGDYEWPGQTAASGLVHARDETEPELPVELKEAPSPSPRARPLPALPPARPQEPAWPRRLRRWAARRRVRHAEPGREVGS